VTAVGTTVAPVVAPVTVPVVLTTPLIAVYSTKVGNTFVGWSLDSSTIIYAKSVDSDLTFYAVWSANPYAVLATSNGFGIIDSSPARVAR
jgi:uncharacterized repeat protein (TIGR02543 family)